MVRLMVGMIGNCYGKKPKKYRTARLSMVKSNLIFGGNLFTSVHQNVRLDLIFCKGRLVYIKRY